VQFLPRFTGSSAHTIMKIIYQCYTTTPSTHILNSQSIIDLATYKALYAVEDYLILTAPERLEELVYVPAAAIETLTAIKEALSTGAAILRVVVEEDTRYGTIETKIYPSTDFILLHHEKE